MPKFWVKNYFTHWRFPEVGQKQKTEKKKKKKERAKVVENNGQATHGARKPSGPKIKKILLRLQVFFLLFRPRTNPSPKSIFLSIRLLLFFYFEWSQEPDFRYATLF